MTDGDTNLDDRTQVAVSKIQERISLQLEQNIKSMQTSFDENIGVIQRFFCYENIEGYIIVLYIVVVLINGGIYVQ